MFVTRLDYRFVNKPQVQDFTISKTFDSFSRTTVVQNDGSIAAQQPESSLIARK